MNGPEILEISVWVWDMLVMGILPLLSAMMLLYFTVKIGKAAQITLPGFIKKSLGPVSRRR